MAVFQPHLYSRTRDFYKDFAHSFFDADVLFITDVYAAREPRIEGVSGKLIADTAAAMGHKHVNYIEDKAAVASVVFSESLPGDMMIILGAGDIWKVANELAEKVSAAA